MLKSAGKRNKTNNKIRKEGYQMATDKLTLVSYGLQREELESRIESLIREHKSFEVVDVKMWKQSTVVNIIERAIEANGMKCRVRTNGRGFVAAALAIPTLGASAVAATAIAAHNLATVNPDYEIIKEMIGSDVRVIYFKSKGVFASMTGEW